ncbi:TetR/AcrR family transcriptional regulator [Nonomuraea sp. SBT364]|uniref:TetR/AcrR family transcriptional regulator n=1 Tax=Nonomuraea sp. SBT364 TaxID=1580530 RepID=UPI00066AEF92|nr:TetR/AcrR family transcriptional regulator [Nonomuraea sp. SBT364]
MTKQFSSVWLREARPAKSTGRSRDEIVRAAVELLDADGLDGLSMRRLGAKLSAGATSLYWYVANKDELLELVYDEVWGEMRLPDPTETTWRATASVFAHSMRRLILRHPWTTRLIGRLPALGPNALGAADTLRRSFHLAGFEGLEIDYANTTLTSFVFGITIPEVAWTQAMAETAYHEDSMREAVALLAADYPDLASRMNEVHSADTDAVREMAFSFGLGAVLDGLAARLIT